MVLPTAGCSTSGPSGTTTQSAARPQRLRTIVGHVATNPRSRKRETVPASVARSTILITDHNTFRFPKASGVGTHPAGTFTVNPLLRTPNKLIQSQKAVHMPGQLTRGIYEILDATHKRACWGPPGGPRPTGFTSPPGSGRILQYWKKIGPVPSG